MMPMSPADYNALRQLVTPVDMADIVSATATPAFHKSCPHDSTSSFFSLFCFQEKGCGFEVFDDQVDRRKSKLSSEIGVT